jgi:adenylate cyclase
VTQQQAEALIPDVRAYELYLQGRHAFNKLTRRSLETARTLFERAIEIDPEFGRAYAGLTGVFFSLYNYWGSSEEYLIRADEASRKALEHCPDTAEAHAARGQALSLRGSEEAKQEFERAIELDPLQYDAYHLAARFHFARGESEEAARLFRQAHDVRPEEYQSLVLGANALRQLGRVEEAERTELEALEAIQSHLELYPDDARAYYLGAKTWQLKGMPEKAHEWAERALAAEPDDAAVHYNLACFYAELDDPNKALGHLARSIELGFTHRAWAENDSDFEGLREDPRFQALLDRMVGGPEGDA